MSLLQRLLKLSSLAPAAPEAQAARVPRERLSVLSERPRATRLSPAVVFTPTKPKLGSRHLTGRQVEQRRILQALAEDRAHVVLYSERGRGKTSLSNMVVESLRRSGVIVARHTCDTGSTFDSILRGLVRDLPSSLLASPGTNIGEGCEAALPNRTLRPGDLIALPDRLACRSLVCLVDEFDRVEDSQTRTQLADGIKQLSDRDVPLLFLVVGVSENLDEILGQHPSIQRSVLGIHLPLFTDRDVAQLIEKGGSESGFTFSDSAVARITVLSRGMPYMAQLLGLRLTQAATERGAFDVTDDDFEVAVSRLIADANPRVLALHAALTDRGRDAEMVAALRRLATAPQDAWGRMEVMELPDGRVSVNDRRISRTCWQRLLDAGVFAPISTDSGLYVFAERLLMHHVLLLAAHDVAGFTGGVFDKTVPGKSPVMLRPVASKS